MAGTSLTFDLLARDRATKSLRNVSGEAGRTRKAFGAMGRGTIGTAKLAGKAIAGLAVATAAMAAGAVVVGKKLVDAGERAGTSNARIEQITKSMGLFGKGADDVSARLVKLANKTALQTGMDQNAIKETQAKLMTFKQLAKTADQTGGAFDRTMKAAIDLEAAGFGPAQQQAVQLGKAMNDPIRGLTALRRNGIQFTKQQEQQIATLVESGKVGKAQAMILKEIETQVGGTAKATANGTDRMKVAFSQVTEQIGMKLVPVVDKLATWFAAKAMPAILKMANVLSTKLKPVFETVVGAVKDFFDSLTGGGNASQIKRFIDQLMEMGRNAIPVVVNAFRTVGDILKKLFRTALPIFNDIRGAFLSTFKKALPDIKSAMTSIKQIVVTVLDIVKAAWKKFGPFVLPIIKTVFGTIFKVIGGVLKAVAGVVKTILAVIKGDWKGAWNGIKQVLSGVWQAIKALIGGALKVIKKVLGAAWAFIKAFTGRSWDAIKKVIGKAWDDTKRKIGQRVDEIKRFLSRAWQAIRDTVSRAWRRVKDTITGAWDAIRRTVGDRIDSVKRTLARAWVAIREAVGRAWNRVKEKIFDAFRGIGRKINEFRDAAPRRLFDAGKKLISGLRNGVVDAMRGIKNWLRDNVWSPIVKGVKSLFGINSPSTVFADFGFQMIRGLVKGLVQGNAGKFVKKVFGGVTGQAEKALNWLVEKGHVTAKEISKVTGAFQGSGILGGLGGRLEGGVSGGPQAYARGILPAFGWGASQWPALKALWHNESGWNPLAHNPISGAHGIPQSLPWTKMLSEGADAWSNAATQIRWGMKYIRDRYGSPSAAWAFWNRQSPHWYGHGLQGGIFKRPTLIGVGENGPERVDVTPLNRSRRSGGGDTHVHVQINAPVGSQRELERWFVHTFRRVERTVRAA